MELCRIKCGQVIFLGYQGLKVKETIMYQDNKSEILYENNGKDSISNRTNHINIRYFCINNLIKQGELEVK